jgi:hypothetical protein
MPLPRAAAAVRRKIEEGQQEQLEQRIPAGRLRDQIPSANLGPQGNTGSGYTPIDHNHTGAGDGGVLTNDDHAGYSQYAEVSAPSTPAANRLRLYAKDKSGTSALYYKDDGGTEHDLSATGGGALTIDDGVTTVAGVADLTLSGATIADDGGGAATLTVTGGGSSEGHILIVDSKSTGTHAGASTSGSWQTRDLNTEKYDTGSNASVAANQITLAAGTYRVRASAPAVNGGAHQARLYDITNSAVLCSGTSAYCPNGASQSESVVIGRFTIAGSTVIELQHRVQSSQGTFGLGVSSGAQFTVTEEVYATVELWKE